MIIIIHFDIFYLKVTIIIIIIKEHLACFLPGTLALGYMNGLASSHLDLAKDLIKTCYAMYSQTPLHLSPEIVNFAQMKDDDRIFYFEVVYIGMFAVFKCRCSCWTGGRATRTTVQE